VAVGQGAVVVVQARTSAWNGHRKSRATLSQ
jgi:hypothetical protein